MPYKSAKQAAYLHINKPEIAKKWDAEGAKVIPNEKKTLKDTLTENLIKPPKKDKKL